MTYFWNKDRFETLAEVSNRLRQGNHVDFFVDYIDYLDLRCKGLRKDALQAANRFAEAYASDPFEIRQRVCIHLIELSERFWDSWPRIENWLVPGNLLFRLFTPTWREWRERKPVDIRAWTYDFGYQAGLQPGHNVAFLTEPGNPSCQYAYIRANEGFLDYALHELRGLGYILSTVKDFNETVFSLKAAAHALGENLNPVVIPYLEWLQLVASALEESETSNRRLSDILLERQIPRVPDISPKGLSGWFLTLPDVIRK